MQFTTQALDLAAQATEHAQFKDWWWKVQLGKCYYRQVTHKHFFFSWHLKYIIYLIFLKISLTFADSVYIEKQKNSSDLLSTTKKWSTRISTWQR